MLFNFKMKKPAAERNPDDVQCLCGRLIARWVGGAIELRCQRCKRTLRLELDGPRIHVKDVAGV
jgi:hypothetical protein